MFAWNRVVQLLLVAALGLTALPATAQEDRDPHRRGYGSMMNFDAMANAYARLLVRKYDLDKEQDEFTQQLIQQKTRQFLEGREDDLRELIDQLFDARTGGEMSQDGLIAWGQRVLPIYEEAREIIISSNDDWREILTEEQRAIHDKDVKLMWQSFETTEEQLDLIVTGVMTVEEFRNPRRNVKRPPRNEQTEVTNRPQTLDRERRPATGTQNRATRPVPPSTGEERPAPRSEHRDVQPPRVRTTPAKPPARPPADRTTSRRPGRGRATAKSADSFESKWDAYVKEFIEKYQLDKDQQQKAHTILKSCKEQASRHIQRFKTRIELLDKQIEALKKSKDKDRGKKLAEIARKRAKLMAPIEQIFEKRLKPQLEKLPNRAQRAAAEAASKTSKKSAGTRKRRGDGDK